MQFPSNVTVLEKAQSLIYPLIKRILRMSRSFPLIIEGSVPREGQFIYVVNHFCVHDIPTIGEVIGRHAYVLVSTVDKHTLGGVVLSIYGAVWVDRRNKVSRQRAKEALKRHLALGHNVIIFPESTWNLSPNLLILPMRWGIIDLSQSTGIPILPVITYYTEKACHVKICEPLLPLIDKGEAIQQLRDQMATAVFLLMEKYPRVKRADLAEMYWDEALVARCNAHEHGKKTVQELMMYESQFIHRKKNETDSERCLLL